MRKPRHGEVKERAGGRIARKQRGQLGSRAVLRPLCPAASQCQALSPVRAQLVTAKDTLTSWGGMSNEIVLMSTLMKLSVHGRIKNKPAAETCMRSVRDQPLSSGRINLIHRKKPVHLSGSARSQASFFSRLMVPTRQWIAFPDSTVTVAHLFSLWAMQ